MPDLATQIRAYFDDVDPSFDLDELATTPIAAPKARSWRRPRPWATVALSAAAVVVLVGAIGFLVDVQPRGDEATGPVAELNALTIDDIPAFRATVVHDVNPDGAPGYGPAGFEGTVEVSYAGVDVAGLRVELVDATVPSGDQEAPAVGRLLVWDGGATVGLYRGEVFEQISIEEFGPTVGDYAWQTGAWSRRCAGAEVDLLGGENIDLGTETLLGREAVHLRCRTPHAEWELWVDRTTGIVVRVDGSTGDNPDLGLRGSPSGGARVVALELEPSFSPDTFLIEAPDGVELEGSADMDAELESELLRGRVADVPALHLSLIDEGGPVELWWDPAGPRARVEFPEHGLVFFSASSDLRDLFEGAWVVYDPAANTYEEDSAPPFDYYMTFVAPVDEVFQDAASQLGVTLANTCTPQGSGEVLGRAVERHACPSDAELWIDVETRLVLRWLGAEGPGFEVSALEVGPTFEDGFFEPPADASLVAQFPDAPHPLEGTPAPELSGELLRGGRFSLSDHIGERVALLFWASWCPPCLDDMGPFQTLASERDDVTFVTVLTADEPQAAAEMMLRGGWTLPVVDLTDRTTENYLPEAWQLYGIPMTVLIDGDGAVVRVIPGAGGIDGMRQVMADVGW